MCQLKPAGDAGHVALINLNKEFGVYYVDCNTRSRTTFVEYRAFTTVSMNSSGMC